MDNGNLFLDYFARLMEDRRECMELIQEDTFHTRHVDGSGNWRLIAGKRVKQITASGVHEVFAVDTKNKLYRCRKPCLGGWEEMDGHFNQVDAANHGVYGITCKNDIMGTVFDQAS